MLEIEGGEWFMLIKEQKALAIHVDQCKRSISLKRPNEIELGA
jgi:hypothetical protein